MNTIFLKTLFFLLTGFFLLVLSLYIFQRQMMYFPLREKPLISRTGLDRLEEITVQTEDGLSIFGWYIPPRQKEGSVLLWFHGNASHVGVTAYRARPYIEAGYGVLMAEYRGYAGNPGKPTEKGLYQDARAFRKWLNDSGFTDAHIIVYGESIGSGPAVELARDGSPFQALVLESAFTSTTEIAAKTYPFVPVRLMLKDRYDNLSKIGTIAAPLIVVHGEADRIVPFAHGQKLFNAAPEPKSFVSVPNGDHNTLDDYNIAERILALLSE